MSIHANLCPSFHNLKQRQEVKTWGKQGEQVPQGNYRRLTNRRQRKSDNRPVLTYPYYVIWDFHHCLRGTLCFLYSQKDRVSENKLINIYIFLLVGREKVKFYLHNISMHVTTVINTWWVSLRGEFCTIHWHSFKKISQLEHLISIIHNTPLWIYNISLDLCKKERKKKRKILINKNLRKWILWIYGFKRATEQQED